MYLLSNKSQVMSKCGKITSDMLVDIEQHGIYLCLTILHYKKNKVNFSPTPYKRPGNLALNCMRGLFMEKLLSQSIFLPFAANHDNLLRSKFLMKQELKQKIETFVPMLKSLGKWPR